MDTGVDLILSEISQALSNIEIDASQNFIREILNSNKIVVAGAGRVGLSMRGFAMRLGQMGLNSYSLGDSNVPSLSGGDLLIIGSGSGETQTIYDITTRASEKNVPITLLTANIESRIAKLAKLIIKIDTPNKTSKHTFFNSKQPMTTLFEQCLYIYFDSLVLDLMSKLGETNESMWNRHSILE